MDHRNAGGDRCHLRVPVSRIWRTASSHEDHSGLEGGEGAMKLVHLSDLHLGFRQYQRQTPAGLNQREADVAAAFRKAIDSVIELRPDLIVIAGDVFHAVRPTNPAILAAYTHFTRLVQMLPDAIIVMVAGNHDMPRTTETGCL